MAAANPNLAWLIHQAFSIFYAILIVRVVFSFLRLPPWHWASRTIGAFCEAVTEPLLRPLRRWLDRYQRASGFDFSPLLLYFLMVVAERVVIRLLAGVGG